MKKFRNIITWVMMLIAMPTFAFAANESFVIAPQTGDETNFTVWIVVAVIALAAIIGMIIYNKKKK